MTLSIVTVSHRSDRHLPHYVRSFLESRSGRLADIEFVIVENSGDTRTRALLRPLEDAGFRTTYLEVENRGFGAGCNAGAAAARGDTLIFANPDLVFVDSLDPIDAAVAAGRRWGTVMQVDGKGGGYAFDVLPEYKTVTGELRRRYRSFGPADPVWRDRLYPVGSFFVVARALFGEAGGFDERFFMYHEEAELSRRLHKLAGPPSLFEGIEVRHEAFGSEASREATLRREAQGLLTYAAITGERGVVRTRAATQLLLAPVSRSARLRLKLLVEEARARAGAVSR